MKISVQNIDDIAAGSAFLATGGGGDPYVGALTAKQAIAKYGEVNLVALDALDDDATVIALGGIGAPVISLEKLPNGREQEFALAALEEHIGKKADALIAFEVGGANSLLTFIAAAARGLPVVDADGMGRALPEMQMTTFAISGVNGTPMAVADEHGNSAVITAADARTAERISRNVALAMGGQCTSAESVMSGRTVKDAAISGSISLCLAIGARLRCANTDASAFVRDLHGLMENSVYGAVEKLLDGKVVDIERKTDGGFDFGTIMIEDLAPKGGHMRIRVQNEFLLAEKDGALAASTPDLICIIDSETSAPVTSDRIRYGQRITVIAIGAPAIYTTLYALKAVGPRAFGYDADYRPLEQLTAGRGEARASISAKT